MQSKGPDFIPTKSGKKGEILRKVGYKESDLYRYKASFFENQKIHRKIVRVTKTQALREYWQEIAMNIMNDANLSQSYGNPEWYPPVPKDKILEGKTCIPPKTHKKTKELSSEDFAKSWVFTSNIPITMDEWEKYDIAGSPYVSGNGFYTHIQSMRTTRGIIKRKKYSYPNIVERVKWFVTFCCHEQGNELLGVYCYEGKNAIEELTLFLAETPVANEGEKYEAILHLSNIYQKIDKST